MIKTCEFDGCEKTEIKCRGLCSVHYRRLRESGLLQRVRTEGGSLCACGKPVNAKGMCVACHFRDLNARGLCTRCRKPSQTWKCEVCKGKERKGGKFVPEPIKTGLKIPKNEPVVYFLTPEELAEINRKYPKREKEPDRPRDRNTITTMLAFI